MNLAKYSFKIVKFMIFIMFKSHIRKNLVSISSLVKNLEPVVQKFVEFAGVSFWLSSLEKNPEAVIQRCYVKIRRKTPELESLFNIVTGLRCFQINSAKYFKNTYL